MPTKTMTTLPVWEQTIDQGRYRCRVDRSDERNGVLTITLVYGGFQIHEQSVRLSYGAQFGPDSGDLAEWRRLCETAIDFPETRNPPL